MAIKKNWYGIKQVYAWKDVRADKIECFEERILLVKAASERDLDRILAKEKKLYCSFRQEKDRTAIISITGMYEIFFIADCEHDDNPLEVFSHLYRRKRSIGKFLESQEMVELNEDAVRKSRKRKTHDALNPKKNILVLAKPTLVQFRQLFRRLFQHRKLNHNPPIRQRRRKNPLP